MLVVSSMILFQIEKLVAVCRLAIQKDACSSSYSILRHQENGTSGAVTSDNASIEERKV